MADPINVANSAAQLAGKTLLTREDTVEIIGAWNFATAPAAPFTVEDGSAKVDHLNADLLDGEEGAAYHNAGGLVTGIIPAGRFPDPLPAVSGEALTNLNAANLTGVVAALLKGFAFSAGQSNAAGSVDTQLASYDVPIPGAFAQPGDAIIIEGALSIAANADNPKLFKAQLGAGSLVTFMSTALNVANHVAPFRVVLRRRTPATGSMTGVIWLGATDGGVLTPYLINKGLTGLDWTIDQTLKVFANSATIGTVLLTDYYVLAARGVAGALV
jgi:hypothetical protein